MILGVVLCLIAMVASAPAPPPRSLISYPAGEVHLLRFENDHGQGNYKYVYEQTDGTRAEQSGQILNEGRETESLSVVGSFQWLAPNGVTYTVHYTADEQGYKPEVEEGPGALPPSAVASLLG